MTLGGWLATLFPPLHLISVIITIAFFCKSPSLYSGGAILIVIYLLPVLFFRLHQFLWPLKSGKSRLDQPIYSPWWTSHQFQAIFNAIPTLEAILRFFPGVYSFWLRLWGSQIGRNVYWTPLVEITDRSLIEIGDRVIFGHKVILIPHVVVRNKTGETFLYIRKIKIGSFAFIGAGSKFGPGSIVKPYTTVPLQTELKINQRI